MEMFISWVLSTAIYSPITILFHQIRSRWRAKYAKVLHWSEQAKNTEQQNGHTEKYKTLDFFFFLSLLSKKWTFEHDKFF